MLTLTVHPKNNQRLSGDAVAKNTAYAMYEIEAALQPYRWATFLFETESQWAAYAITRASNQNQMQPEGE
jgi:hypothetical protein